MNINASIIDQRLNGVQDEIREWAASELNITDPGRIKSLAFVYFCVKTMLDLDSDQAFDALTEGGGDFGVDAIHLTEDVDGEFSVSLFQAKYKPTSLEGISEFPESGIAALVRAVCHLFDPSSDLGAINPRLKAKVETARSMIRDGLIPRVRALACNNGLKWNASGQSAIDRSDLGEQVTWEHINHDTLIRVLQAVSPVDDTLKFIGKAIIEDMNFSRVYVGRMPVLEIAALMKRHGERLLERNIRRYLGLFGNRVNEGIRDTLRSQEPENFYFFNNGLTLICDHFKYNALQGADHQVQVDNLQIVNGGQTCMTIAKTVDMLTSYLPFSSNQLPNASVLVRLYELPKNSEDLVLQITHATNSQNPVDLKDLRSNDKKQLQLETDIRNLGYNYRRKKTATPTTPWEFTSGVAAEAVLAVWRYAPHQAKFFTREHFGKLYSTIFTESLNGSQVISAVFLHRIAEKHRRRPLQDDPHSVRYASCFIAMQMGRRLLRDLGVELGKLDHRNFEEAKKLIESRGESYFRESVDDVELAVRNLYGANEVSLQQLSATFRRGDLIDSLKAMDV
jgi:hypothetical protein